MSTKKSLSSVFETVLPETVFGPFPSSSHLGKARSKIAMVRRDVKTRGPLAEHSR